MRNVKALRDEQLQERNPGHEIGTMLLRHSNSPAYLISQLEAYLEAARADRSDEMDWARAMLAGLARQRKDDRG